MVKVKICGITNFKDARAAVDAGADLLGFIFYPPSPRYVMPEVVRDIVRQARGNRGAGAQGGAAPLFVGVFVNETPETIEHILDFCKLDAVQLHGDEPPEVVAHFAGRGYKALRPKSLQDAEGAIINYQLTMNKNLPVVTPRPPGPPALLPELLLDAYHPKLYGGTGHVADWDMAARVARRLNIMLAGSLSPENVAGAISAVRPWGVDVSSGVEQEKGRKNHAKVRALIEAVRSIDG